MKIIGSPVYRFGDLRIRRDNHLGKYDFSVGLARNFVLEVMNTSIDDSFRESFQKIGQDVLAGDNRDKSYSFHENSLLVVNFGLCREGRWLNVPLDDIVRFRKGDDPYLVYSSHNVDRSHDRNALQTLFTTWVDYVPTALEALKDI
jgi:hypothetical protein